MNNNDKNKCSFLLLLSLFLNCCGHEQAQCGLCGIKRGLEGGPWPSSHGETRDLPCDHMVSGCRMQYIPRNSSECKNLQLSGSHARHFGDVKLDTYMYLNKNTAFNLTANITSPTRPITIKFRYQVGKYINLCRIFKINESMNRSPFVLFYDCRVSTPEYEGKIVNFEYEVSDGSSDHNDYRSLSCRVPLSDYTGPRPPDLGLLLCVEVVEKIVVHWSPAQTEFITKYRINITRCGSSEPFHTVEEYNASSTHFDRPSYEMCFFISIEPWLKNEGAWGSAIKSADFRTHRTIPTSVYILGGFSVVIMLIAACVSWCFWESKRKINTRVLISYSESSENHERVISSLVAFLEKNLNVKEVFYPERDIPMPWNSETWFRETLKKVDVVLVLSSPRNTPMETVGTRYGDRYVERYYSKCPPRIVKVVLPRCGDQDFSRFCDHFPCYDIYKDFGSLLRLLLRKSPWLIVPFAFYKSGLKAQLNSALQDEIRTTNNSDQLQLPQVYPMVPQESEDPDSSSESDSASIDDLGLLERQAALRDRLRRDSTTEPSDVESKDSHSM